MQKFEYRSPRFAVDLPAQFSNEQSTLQARCRDISMEGLRLELSQPLPPDACGTVVLSFQDHALPFSVRVAHTGGMEFIYRTDRERDAVARLIASLAASATRPRLMLVN